MHSITGNSKPCLLRFSALQNWLRFADNKFVGTIPEEYANLTPELYQLTLVSEAGQGEQGWLSNRGLPSSLPLTQESSTKHPTH